MQRFRMEKVFSPKFDGSIRIYFAPEQSAFTLRQCLLSDVMVYLGNDNDLNGMLKFLEKRYGDPGKLVESVIGEIQQFKRVDNVDWKRIIQSVNILDTGYRDLKNLKLEKEIASPM